MRLIDADNLKPDAQWEFFYNCYFAYSISQIDDAPTVKAVPIEEVLRIIEFEEKWLYQTRMSIRDIDIAFNAMKSKIKQIEGSGEEQANANQHNSNALNALEGDAISRQAVTEIINDIRDCISVEGYCAILERMKKLPSVNSQQKTGHWVDTGSGQECSECHEIQYGYDSNRKYCANCGFRMVEPQESEDKG